VSSAAALPASSVRSTTTTRAPSPASLRAHASPIPDAPPVTTAPLPSSSPAMAWRTLHAPMAEPFANFQYEIYMAGMSGAKPGFPIAYRDLEAKAREILSPEAFDYVAGGAGSEDTVRENLEAFRRWRIVPRMLKGVAERDLSVEIFGTHLPAPVLLAPVGVQSIIHE